MLTALALLLAASGKLPPAAPLPMPGTTEEEAVMAPVNALFAALTARDGAALQALGTGAGTITTAVEKPDGSHVITQRGWPEWTASIKPGPERWEERLISPAVEIDGDIAMVWGAYSFSIDGKLHHCGVDHFDLVRKDGAWKIANVTWSSRMTGCDK